MVHEPRPRRLPITNPHILAANGETPAPDPDDPAAIGLFTDSLPPVERWVFGKHESAGLVRRPRRH